LVSFPNNPVPGKYDVWSTDYKYTLIYSCSQIIPALLKFELIWILSRERTLDAQTITTLKDLLKSKNVDINKFEKTDQTGC
jgi:lipocalin